MKTWAWMSLALWALAACNNSDGGAAPPNRQQEGQGYGAQCVLDGECREGLVCPDGTCLPAGTTAQDDTCALTGECQDGLYCDWSATCQPAGQTPAGLGCAQTSDCQAGLICRPAGLSGVCAEPLGVGDLGDECTSFLDCLAGLGCGTSFRDPGGPTQCLPGPEGGIPTPYEGAPCEGDGVTPLGQPRVFFEVPDGAPLADFYRLPYPNDARLTSGHPSVSDHPTPGSAGIGVDLVKTYLDKIQAEQDGFGLNEAVFFRFSARMNYDTFDANAEEPTHYLVNITPSSPSYNQRPGIFWQSSTSATRYICHNWMTVRPAWGRPLDPDTTYAVVLTDKLKTQDGQPLVQDADFAAMLTATRPPDEALGAAWDKHAPLRAWLTEQGIDPATIMGASVFTTGDPYAVARKLRGAVRAAPAPTASDLTACGGVVTSPCDDGLTGEDHQRGCFEPNPAFHEVHGRVSLPIFQVGQEPYLEEGGGLALDPQGVPLLQRQAPVCVGLAVPKQPMPEAGWPVLIYAHGTGGSFRSHMQDVAQTLTTLEVDGQPTPFVVLGWDQVLHGARRNGSSLEPEALVYNFLNPDAARGNFLQAAAELHALVYFVENFELSAQDSPTGEPLKLDPTRIYFLGHSQGGTSGPLALPFAPEVKGAVLSGAGGGLIWSLLGKTSPVNIPVGVQLALRDPDALAAGDSHPALNLLQAFFGPVDPINYGPYLAARRLGQDTTPRHVLHTLGIGDTYTPPRTLQTLATSMRAPIMAPLLEPFLGRDVTPVDAPQTQNVTVEGQRYTLVSRQYAPPPGVDGHFVLFRSDAARDDLIEFLGSALTQPAPILED